MHIVLLISVHMITGQANVIFGQILSSFHLTKISTIVQ